VEHRLTGNWLGASVDFTFSPKTFSKTEVVMSRITALFLAAFVVVTPIVLYAQHAHVSQIAQNTGAKSTSPAKPKMTDAQKITNAMSAAPPELAKNATIMDWPDTPNGKPRQLRAGSNGWVCYPNSPETFKGAPGDDPMCLDKSWQTWAEAWMSKSQPKVGSSGIAYMLKGDKGVSNTDPFATGPAGTNQWVVSPPHVMVLFPDTKMLDSYPTDPQNGGPWVMWKGTPYAHLMVPVSSTKAALLASK
jgi:hypothetical protein